MGVDDVEGPEVAGSVAVQSVVSSQIPAEVAGFKDVSASDSLGSYLSGHNQTILDLEVKDKKQKLCARKIVGTILILLLIGQNVAIAWFVYAAYVNGNIESLATVISVVCTSTLAETAAIVHTMVRWIFSDVEYKIK
jgi:hypothetical protein